MNNIKKFVAEEIYLFVDLNDDMKMLKMYIHMKIIITAKHDSKHMQIFVHRYYVCF